MGADKSSRGLLQMPKTYEQARTKKEGKGLVAETLIPPLGLCLKTIPHLNVIRIGGCKVSKEVPKEEEREPK